MTNQLVREKSVRQQVLARRTCSIAWKIVRFLLLFSMAFALLYPFIFMITNTFRAEVDTWDPSVIWITRHFTLDNLIKTYDTMNYGSALEFTLLISIGSALLQMFVCALVGYGFARFKFKGKGLLFGIVILTILVPSQIIMLPSYRIVKALGLIDSPLAFWVQSLFGMGIRSGLFIFIYRQSFRGLPSDLEDAAAVDGCSAFGTYFKIMLPNAFNSLIVVFMFSLVWHWNDYFNSRIYTITRNTVSTQLSLIRNQFAEMLYASSLSGTAVSNPLEMQVRIQAGVLLSVLPLLIVFAIGQKFLRQGIERTGIVG